MVFRKGGRLNIDEQWTYNGLNVEVVDSFNHVGTVFRYNEEDVYLQFSVSQYRLMWTYKYNITQNKT